MYVAGGEMKTQQKSRFLFFGTEAGVAVVHAESIFFPWVSRYCKKKAIRSAATALSAQLHIPSSSSTGQSYALWARVLSSRGR